MMVSTRSKDSAKGLPECCMCGDYGLLEELFQCNLCTFRSQHRYCSNLYPKAKAESYRVCNWCLSQTIHPMTDSTDPKSTRNSSTSSLASQSVDPEEELEDMKSINKKSRTKRHDDDDDHGLVVQINGPDHKKQSKTPSPPSVARKRIITRGALEERLIRRTKSEEILNNNNNAIKNNTNYNNNDNKSNHSEGIITKHVFRNKVRRYKLLEEVSS